MGNYRTWLAAAVSTAAFTALALAVVLAVLLVVLDGVEFGINLSLELSRFEGLWLLVLLPPVVVLIAVIASPLAYLLYRLASRLRRKPVNDPPL